jgi:alkylation response protein AidB-like acyl-CoA dehydrogenase
MLLTVRKVWISRIQHSDLMVLLARTTPLAEVKKKSEGMSIFIVNLEYALANGHDYFTYFEYGEPRTESSIF